MKKYYIIIPVVLLTVFVVFERSAAKEAEAVEQAKVEQKKAADAKKEAEKKALEEKARADSEKRNQQRIAEEKAKDEKKKADFEAKIQRMKDDVKRYTDDVDAQTREASRLEKELLAKREQRDRENRAVFDLAKKVEVTRKLRRDAELEVQRFNEMLARRAAESSMTKAPVVVTGADKQ
jgi:hypothetical protein